MFSEILLEIIKQEKIDIATIINVIWLIKPLETATWPIRSEPIINIELDNPFSDLLPAWKKIWKKIYVIIISTSPLTAIPLYEL